MPTLTSCTECKTSYMRVKEVMVITSIARQTQTNTTFTVCLQRISNQFNSLHDDHLKEQIQVHSQYMAAIPLILNVSLSIQFDVFQYGLVGFHVMSGDYQTDKGCSKGLVINYREVATKWENCESKTFCVPPSSQGKTFRTPPF